MTDEYVNQVLLDLQSALAKLAAPATEQIAHLKKLELLPSVDELALEFDDLVGLVPQLVAQGCLTQEQAERLRGLDQILTEMSGSDDLWTENALREREIWQEVRRLAALSEHSITWPVLS